MEKKEKRGKTGFHFPNVLVFFVIMMLIVAILTYLIPAGQFDTQVDEETGRTYVVAGSYHEIEKNPTTVMGFLSSFLRGMEFNAAVIFFVLIIGGAFQVITSTGVISKISMGAARKFAGNEVWVIPIFVCLFATFGTTMAMSQELVLFVPLGVAIARSMGFDALTGTGMIGLGAVAGYSVGLTSPFNTGVAQKIAEVPLYSGMGFRAVLGAILLVVTCAYLMRYASKVKKNPQSSLVYDLEVAEAESTKLNLDEEERFNGRDWIIVAVLVGGLAYLIYGVAKGGWWFEEMSALFLTIGVVAGFVKGFGPSKVAKEFISGVEMLAMGAVIVGCAGSINVIMNDACIRDTIINACANAISGLPNQLSAVGMYITQTLINFPIVSGSGQATATMPLMVPLGDLVGVSRQTTVLAFLLGDGFTNSIYPTAASMMTYIAMVKIPYGKWFRFAGPLVGIWFLIGLVAVLIAATIGY